MNEIKQILRIAAQDKPLRVAALIMLVCLIGIALTLACEAQEPTWTPPGNHASPTWTPPGDHALLSSSVCNTQPPDGIVPATVLTDLDAAIERATVIPTEPDPVKWDRRAFWATRFIDSGTTWYGLQDGASEANPLLGGFDGPAEIVGFQFLVSYLVDEYAQHLISQDRIREARMIYRVGAVVNGLTAGWNFAQIASQD